MLPALNKSNFQGTPRNKCYQRLENLHAATAIVIVVHLSHTYAGGSSLFGSSKERLDRELLDLAPQAAKVKVTVHQNATERKFSVWLGGSILGCLGSFHQLWMSKQEYAENGAALVHRRSP